MKYAEKEPASERLKQAVRCIWTLQRTYADGGEAEVLWPDPCKEIIVHHGQALRAGGERLPASFVMGTLSGHRRLDARGTLLLYGVRLHPWGLSMISNEPVQRFNDRFTPLRQALAERHAGWAAELEQSLQSGDLDAARQRLEAFLADVLLPDKADPDLFAALRRLTEWPEAYGVADAARDAGLSLRQFERRCRQATGLAPKRLHKLARFNRVRMRLLMRPESDLHDVMLEAGYYDYSHFSKDFRQCLGLTPAAFRAWAGRLAGNHAPDVEFLQDKTGTSRV